MTLRALDKEPLLTENSAILCQSHRTQVAGFVQPLPRADPINENAKLNADELERYDRQIGPGVLSEAAQLRLKNSTAFVSRVAQP